MILPDLIQEQSIGSFVAEKIVDLAKDTNKNHILDEISIYGTSDKDGSATLAFEWLGDSLKDSKMAEEVYCFFKKIRGLLIGLKKEVIEQAYPDKEDFSNTTRIIYRFRIWNEDGEYEFFNRELAVN